MNHADLESTYELLEIQLDKFDESTAPVYLAKVALLMTTEIDDMDVIRKCVQTAAQALDQLDSKATNL